VRSFKAGGGVGEAVEDDYHHSDPLLLAGGSRSPARSHRPSGPAELRARAPGRSERGQCNAHTQQGRGRQTELVGRGVPCSRSSVKLTTDPDSWLAT